MILMQNDLMVLTVYARHIAGTYRTTELYKSKRLEDAARRLSKKFKQPKNSKKKKKNPAREASD